MKYDFKQHPLKAAHFNSFIIPCTIVAATFTVCSINVDIDCPFQLAAIALIAVGAYVQIALKDYFDLIEGSFSSAAALLIAVGVIIFFIAFFGCCGAYKENRTCVLIVSWFIQICSDTIHVVLVCFKMYKIPVSPCMFCIVCSSGSKFL